MGGPQPTIAALRSRPEGAGYAMKTTERNEEREKLIAIVDLTLLQLNELRGLLQRKVLALKAARTALTLGRDHSVVLAELKADPCQPLECADPSHRHE